MHEIVAGGKVGAPSLDSTLCWEGPGAAPLPQSPLLGALYGEEMCTGPDCTTIDWEGTHKDRQVQLLALHRTSQKSGHGQQNGRNRRQIPSYAFSILACCPGALISTKQRGRCSWISSQVAPRQVSFPKDTANEFPVHLQTLQGFGETKWDLM